MTLLEISVCDLSWIHLLIALLVPFLLGYIFHHFFIGTKRKAELVALKSENATLHTNIKKAKAMKPAVAAPVATVDKSELNSLKDKVRDLDAHNSKLKSDMAEYVAFKQQFAGVNVEKLKSTIAELESREEKLLADLEAQKALNASLTNTYSHAASHDEETDIELLKSNLTNAQNEVSRLNAQVNAIKYERDSINRYNDNINTLRNDVRELSGKVGALTVENERLKAAGTSGVKWEGPELDATKNEKTTSPEVKPAEAEKAPAQPAAVPENAATAPATSPEAVPEAAPEAAPVPQPEAEASAPIIIPDDLTKIEGIGPKIAELCNGIGIFTYQQLADAPLDTLKAMLEAAGSRYQMHDPGTWAQQSALAAAGKWDELKTLQDELNGGK